MSGLGRHVQAGRDDRLPRSAWLPERRLGVEVPVAMRERTAGRSSITAPRSLYYMIKVMLALFISVFRRYPSPPEER